MSYSFQVKAATKADAKALVEEEFEKVVRHQPCHARDKAAAIANANAVIDLLADDDTMDVSVFCHGYVSWQVPGDGSDVPLCSAQISASAVHATRE